jgi:hypothetical protein
MLQSLLSSGNTYIFSGLRSPLIVSIVSILAG